MRRFSAHGLAVLLTAALLAASCGNDTDDAEPSPTTTPPSSTAPVDDDPEAPPADDGFAGSIELTLDQDPQCELIGHECLLPFPSDALTVDDPASATGRRVALPSALVPANADGVTVDIARQNRADGFSPGSAALVLVPGVDPEASGLAPITDIARSIDPDSGSVVVDATTGERWPHWPSSMPTRPTPSARVSSCVPR